MKATNYFRTKAADKLYDAGKVTNIEPNTIDEVTLFPGYFANLERKVRVLEDFERLLKVCKISKVRVPYDHETLEFLFTLKDYGLEVIETSLVSTYCIGVPPFAEDYHLVSASGVVLCKVHKLRKPEFKLEDDMKERLRMLYEREVIHGSLSEERDEDVWAYVQGIWSEVDVKPIGGNLVGLHRLLDDHSYLSNTPYTMIGGRAFYAYASKPDWSEFLISDIDPADLYSALFPGGVKSSYVYRAQKDFCGPEILLGNCDLYVDSSLTDDGHYYVKKSSDVGKVAMSMYPDSSGILTGNGRIHYYADDMYLMVKGRMIFLDDAEFNKLNTSGASVDVITGPENVKYDAMEGDYILVGCTAKLKTKEFGRVGVKISRQAYERGILYPSHMDGSASKTVADAITSKLSEQYRKVCSALLDPGSFVTVANDRVLEDIKDDNEPGDSIYIDRIHKLILMGETFSSTEFYRAVNALLSKAYEIQEEGGLRAMVIGDESLLPDEIRLHEEFITKRGSIYTGNFFPGRTVGVFRSPVLTGGMTMHLNIIPGRSALCYMNPKTLSEVFQGDGDDAVSIVPYPIGNMGVTVEKLKCRELDDFELRFDYVHDMVLGHKHAQRSIARVSGTMSEILTEIYPVNVFSAPDEFKAAYKRVAEIEQILLQRLKKHTDAKIPTLHEIKTWFGHNPTIYNETPPIEFMATRGRIKRDNFMALGDKEPRVFLKKMLGILREVGGARITCAGRKFVDPTSSASAHLLNYRLASGSFNYFEASMFISVLKNSEGDFSVVHNYGTESKIRDTMRGYLYPSVWPLYDRIADDGITLFRGICHDNGSTSETLVRFIHNYIVMGDVNYHVYKPESFFSIILHKLNDPNEWSTAGNSMVCTITKTLRMYTTDFDNINLQFYSKGVSYLIPMRKSDIEFALRIFRGFSDRIEKTHVPLDTFDPIYHTMLKPRIPTRTLVIFQGVDPDTYLRRNIYEDKKGRTITIPVPRDITFTISMLEQMSVRISAHMRFEHLSFDKNFNHREYVDSVDLSEPTLPKIVL